MNNEQQIKYEARAKIAKALAHPARLFMLDWMHDRECSVSELTAELELDQSTVSKHLAVLREAGIVSVRKSGTTSFYRVSCGCLDGFFTCLENVLKCDITKRQQSLAEDSTS